MDDAFTILAEEMAQARVRARRAEQGLATVEQLVEALSLTLWETDGDLRLVNTCGLAIAEPYLDRPIADFYRDVYGIEGPGAQPLAAHHEARSGQRVVLGLVLTGRRYAVIVDPKRDETGQVVGTVGLSLSL